MNYREYMYISD